MLLINQRRFVSYSLYFLPICFSSVLARVASIVASSQGPTFFLHVGAKATGHLDPFDTLAIPRFSVALPPDSYTHPIGASLTRLGYRPACGCPHGGETDDGRRIEHGKSREMLRLVVRSTRINLLCLLSDDVDPVSPTLDVRNMCGKSALSLSTDHLR